MSGNHTPGPWHWVDAETDGPVTLNTRHASLRTVDRYNNGELRDDDHWNTLPITILDCDFTLDNPADMPLTAAAPDLLGVAKEMLPRNLCLTNPNIADDMIVPLECTMGELRKIAAVIAKATGS